MERQGGFVVLENILNQAFDQYIFDRVDDILRIAGTTDIKYSKAAKEVHNTLAKLMVLATELKAHHPELLHLVMDFEAVTVIESGLAAEIAYRQGMRDSSSVRQKFITFIQEQYDCREKSDPLVNETLVSKEKGC
jgi:hypothetical protein